MTDDEIVQALRRHRPVGPPARLRGLALGPLDESQPPLESPRLSPRWWVWLPAAAGVAITIGLGLSASRNHRAIAAFERQMLLAFQEHDWKMVESDAAMEDGRRTESERLLWLADVREAELAVRQPAITSASR